MELEFDITQLFKEDLAQLPALQQEEVKKKINSVSQSLLNGKVDFKENSSIPYIFNLKGGLDSSLFVIKIDKDNRVIAAIDEDPIFDKISLTLFRLVNKNKAKKVYKEVGQDIYSKSGIL